MKQTDEEYEKTRELYGEVEEQLTLLDEQAAEARSKLTATDKLKTELEGQISVLKEQINSALTSRHHLQQRRMDLEGSMREAEEKLRDLTERYEKGSRELTDLQDENDLLVTRLEQSKVKKEELDQQRARVKALESSVDRDLLNEYLTIKKHITPPVARLAYGQCSGCNTSLPSATLSKIKNGNMVECETCGRMIIQ